MKITKITSLILALIITLGSLFSCGATGESPDGDTTPDTPPGTPDGGETPDGDDTQGGGEETFYFKRIVYDSEMTENIDYRSIVNRYQQICGKRIPVSSAESVEATEGEIVFGMTNRSISSRVDRAIRIYKGDAKLGFYDITYAIVVKDGSIGASWEHPYISDEVIGMLIEMITDPDFSAYEEKTVTGKIAIGADLDGADDIKRESALDKLGEDLGLLAEEAVRKHLALANDDFLKWLAGLYEPRTCICDNYDKDGNRVCLLPKDAAGNYLCYGGGFYYSNSARDTAGYYIDIESTVQALNFLASAGLCSGYGGSTYLALPTQMKLDIVAFAKSLQSSEDGYFYHPQWGKSIGVSRLGRDLNWATEIIKRFKDTPFWDTPNGHKGELGAPSGATARVTAPLGESVAAAASKVVLAAVWPDHLATLDAFEKYLDSFNLSQSSYSAGNTVSSQVGQIITRDKEGIASGEFVDANNDGIADNGLIAAFERHFNEAQNPENGLWQDSVHYYSVNGLMKISSAYNSLGVKIPNALEAFESACEMALLPAGVADIKGKQASAAVDVYNPWVAINGIMSNMKKFGSADEAAALKAVLREKAADMITVTTEKTKKFAKPDGSYGYNWGAPPAASQGAPVCPSGRIEGDVNGGIIALNSIWINMSTALGINLNLYGAADGERFLYLLEGIKPTKTKYDLSN